MTGTRTSKPAQPSYEPDQVLVDEADLAPILTELRRLDIAAREEPVAGTGVVRLQLLSRTPVAVGELVQALRRRCPAVRVAPNHLLRPASHMHAVGTRAPEPAPPLPDLPTGDNLPGHGVTIGVIDSGFCDHPWFAGRVEFRPEDVEGPPADTNRPLPFATGHGTFVTGVILQHAPGARVIVRRILNDHGEMSDAELGEAVAELEGVDILNLSLGTTGVDREEAVKLLATANSLFKLWQRKPEMVVVAPAGNDGKNIDFWPGKFDPVVAVAALDASGRSRASFSNFGDWVDACSKGEGVHSRFLDWAGDVEAPPLNEHGRGRRVRSDPFTGWALWDGTSFATARVTGAIAAAMDPANGVDGPSAVGTLLQGPRPVAGCGAVVQPRSLVAP